MAITVSRVNVLNSAATQLLSAATANADELKITNDGPNSIYLGTTNAVTTSNGFVLLKQTSITIAAPAARNLAALWAIAATADQSSPANTSIMVTTRD